MKPAMAPTLLAPFLFGGCLVWTPLQKGLDRPPFTSPDGKMKVVVKEADRYIVGIWVGAEDPVGIVTYTFTVKPSGAVGDTRPLSLRGTTSDQSQAAFKDVVISPSNRYVLIIGRAATGIFDLQNRKAWWLQDVVPTEGGAGWLSGDEVVLGVDRRPRCLVVCHRIKDGGSERTVLLSMPYVRGVILFPSPNGRYVFIENGIADDSIPHRLFDVEAKTLNELAIPTKQLIDWKWSPDGRRLAVTWHEERWGPDGVMLSPGPDHRTAAVLKVFDARSRQEVVVERRRMMEPLVHVEWSEDGSTVTWTGGGREWGDDCVLLPVPEAP